MWTIRTFKPSEITSWTSHKSWIFKCSELYKDQNQIFHKFWESSSTITYPFSNMMKQNHQQTQCTTKEETFRIRCHNKCSTTQLSFNSANLINDQYHLKERTKKGPDLKHKWAQKRFSNKPRLSNESTKPKNNKTNQNHKFPMIK